MAATKHNHNLKHLMITNLSRNHPEMIDRYMGYISERYDKLLERAKNSSSTSVPDWDFYVGEESYKGEVLEGFLRQEGHWEYFYNSAMNMLDAPNVKVKAREIYGGQGVDLDSLKKKNPSQYMEYHARTAAEMFTDPKVRYAFSRKGNARDYAKNVVFALGSAKLSQGTWVGIYKGISKSLRSPIGGGVKKIFESGGIHQVSLNLQSSVAKVGIKKGYTFATEFKERTKKFAKTAFSLALVALSMASLNSSQEIDLLQKTQWDKFVTNVANTVGNEEVDYYASEGFAAFQKDFNVLNSIRVENSPKSHPMELDGKSFDTDGSFVRWTNDIQESKIIVKDGDNLWTIASSLAMKMTDDFRLALVEGEGTSEYEKIVNSIHKQIIESNPHLSNPDLIHKGDVVHVPESLQKTLNGNFDVRLEAADKILNTTKHSLSNKMSL